MFDIGWTELVVIGVVALIVIGPKDLPEMFRTLGRVTAKLRMMARDFQRAMEQAANDSGVGDVAKDLKSMTSAKSLGIDAVKDAATRFEKWDPLKPGPKPVPKTAAPVAAAATPAAAAAPEAAPAEDTKPMGPATRALYEKKAAVRTAAKPAATEPAPQAGSATPAAPPARPAPKPRAPRKPKAAPGGES